MPVIVVGADTPIGATIVEALRSREGEIRVFVTDVDIGLAMKAQGLKTAIGDVSDASHVGGAAIQCFSAILIPDAAFDERERSFAVDAVAVLEGWAEALREGRVTRAIVLDDARVDDIGAIFSDATPELAIVAPGDPDGVAQEVARLDDLVEL